MRPPALALLLLLFAVPALGLQDKVLPRAGETFELAGHGAFVIEPPEAQKLPGATPWVWYAPTLPRLPAAEEAWMFDRFLAAGVAIAGIDVGESYGSPDGVAGFEALYDHLTSERGYAARPVLLARSRGGLMHYAWATKHPDSVAGVAGIYPVCNVASYPGLERAAPAYGRTRDELEAQLAELDPLEQLAGLAAAGVPLHHIHGDRDTVVPLEANSGALAERYRALGGEVELEVVDGGGHDMWPGWFQSQALVDFAVRRALDGARQEGPVRYGRDVQPILARSCIPCHGPDAETRAAGLRLDVPGEPEGALHVRNGVAAIVPGSLDDSELWYRVTTDVEGDLMPPPSSTAPRLEARELAVLRRWIESGAEYESHWAFVAPVVPAVPEVKREAWVRDPIDRFVLARLEADGLAPSSRADRRTLLRRLSLDLIGLPPSPAELAEFLADESPDAYERAVERLLDDPRYGEHMARYWLDLVRYADTNGLHHDHFRDMSAYRDWVIRAWNANLPYDEFVVDQVAGDLRRGASTDQLVASGFNRLHLVIDRGTMLPEESHARNVIDRVNAVGTAFMGLTLGCAVCHDHKYDPITQRDYFSLFAFFNNLDGAPETGGRSGADFRRGLQPPYITFASAEEEARLAELRAAFEAARKKVDGLRKDLQAAQDDEARRAELDATLKEAQATLSSARRDFVDHETSIPGAMVMRERAEPRPAHILVRGQYDQLGERVERRTPGFLPPMDGEPGARTRMDLARWLVSPGHPLTARAAVNRFWQQLHGTGLVETSEDLGTQGERPSHPALLDHLAVSFVESGWDVKALMRRLVLSETYRQASSADTAAFEADPKNRLLARGSRYRLDAEVIRDTILATSGRLTAAMYGPSVKPPQPDGLWMAVALPDSYPRKFVADEGEAARRRSVYTFWKRSLPPPQMTILDAPTREACVARRERTNTPLQALLLQNEREFLAASRDLAASALEDDGDDAARLASIYERITARRPAPEVEATLLTALGDLRELYSTHPELAAELCAEVPLPSGHDADELASWTALSSILYNLDQVRHRD